MTNGEVGGYVIAFFSLLFARSQTTKVVAVGNDDANKELHVVLACFCWLEFREFHPPDGVHFMREVTAVAVGFCHELVCYELGLSSGRMDVSNTVVVEATSSLLSACWDLALLYDELSTKVHARDEQMRFRLSPF